MFSGDGVRGLLDKLHHTDHADRDVRDDDPDDADVRIQRVLSQSESPERRHKEKDSEKTELKRLLLFATGAKLEAEARQKELRQLVEALRLRADAAGTATRLAHSPAVIRPAPEQSPVAPSVPHVLAFELWAGLASARNGLWHCGIGTWPARADSHRTCAK